MEQLQVSRQVKDEDAIHIQKLFSDFLAEYEENGELIYKEEIAQLGVPERNTLQVSFRHLHEKDQILAGALLAQFFRFVLLKYHTKIL